MTSDNDRRTAHDRLMPIVLYLLVIIVVAVFELALSDACAWVLTPGTGNPKIAN